MSKVETLRAMLNQRFTAVVEEICGMFETTIAEYEDIVIRSREETEQQRKLLEAAVSVAVDINQADNKQLYPVKKEPLECEDIQEKNTPELINIKVESVEHWNSLERPQRLEKCIVPVGHVNPESPEGKQQSYPRVLRVFHADVQQGLICKEQTPFKQQESPTIKEGIPEHSLIKEEQTTPCSSQEEEWNGDDNQKVPPNQMEENSEPPASSSTQQMETEDGGDLGLQLDNERTSNSSDCETEDSDDEWKVMPRKDFNSRLAKDTSIHGSEPTKKSSSVVNPVPGSNSNSGRQLHPADKDKLSDSSATEDSDDDWKHNRNPESYLATISLKSSCQSEKSLFHCSTCGKKFHALVQLKKHMNTHPRETNHRCSECHKQFRYAANLNKHMASHSLNINQSNDSESKVSKDKASVTTSKRKHSQEKSLICDKRSRK